MIYFNTHNAINDKTYHDENNLENFLIQKLNNVKNSFFDNLRNPYLELNYNIENNDSIGGILRKFKVSDIEIQKIIEGLREKELTNIYAGRKLSIVLKKSEDGSNSIVSVLYPINNTLSVEIRKNKKDVIEIKENILKLNKKEIVVKNTINNNLYSSATEVGIEPNIIIEFARIYGFEIDFQRDIRKGDV